MMKRRFFFYNEHIRMPPIHAMGWCLPGSFPDLSAAALLSIDLETKDPNLLEKGPGDLRKDGYIVGIAVGVPEGQRWYFPMRHERGENLDPDTVLAWAREQLTRPTQPKIGANVMYDLQWLAAEGITVQGPLIDIQFAEALLDETRPSYSLDSIAQDRLAEGKKDSLLYRWCADSFGGKPDRSQAKNIWRAPSFLVGPYAEGDVDLPLRIWEQQKKELSQQGLLDLMRLECANIYPLLAMRRRGVRVDVTGAHAANDMLRGHVDAFKNQYGVDIWAAADIARVCDKENVPYPRTAKGAPSFTAPWLADQSHPLLCALLNARRYDKARGTFIEGHIFSHLLNDRIHIAFHPLRRDDNDDGGVRGTVSGRFSSTHHNIPARDPELGPLIK